MTAPDSHYSGGAGPSMRSYNPSRPIIYTHVPKCAGTSIIRVLRKWFGKTYHKLNQDETQDELLPRIETRDADGEWLENVKCIHGHFNHGRGYGLPYFYPEIDQYFTILRDPFDLAVSMYFFAKGRSATGKFWFRGKPVDFRKQFPNLESYVNSYPYWLLNHLPQDITLDNFNDKLRQRFVHIGLFEDLQGSVNRLGAIFDKPVVALPHINASQSDEPVADQLRESFYERNPLVKRIYDFAVEHYQ